MVLLIQADNCFCGAVQGIRRQVSKDSCDKSGDKVSPTAKPQHLHPAQALQLPLGPELAPKLAAAIKQVSISGSRRCATAGVAGPVVAIALGAADGLGLSAQARSTLGLALRGELRELAQVLGAEVPSEKEAQVGSAWASLQQQGATRMDAFDLLLDWCASPAVPTYNIGVHLALGDADAAMKATSSEVAWVLRMCCARKRVNISKVAPMFGHLCELLCESDGKEADKLHDVLGESSAFTRQNSEPTMRLRASSSFQPEVIVRRAMSFIPRNHSK
mmetsp:Transcript_56110/g.144460  ORF Transcript_56110/g.144460 Transcript_56110/m.144460 type:complete len:275 (-) Transcript_56110:241-1065(-)